MDSGGSVSQSQLRVPQFHLQTVKTAQPHHPHPRPLHHPLVVAVEAPLPLRLFSFCSLLLTV